LHVLIPIFREKQVNATWEVSCVSNA